MDKDILMHPSDYMTCCLQAEVFVEAHHGTFREVHPGTLAVLAWEEGGQCYEVTIENQEGNVDLSANVYSIETFLAILKIVPPEARKMMSESEDPYPPELLEAIRIFNKENPSDPIQPGHDHK